MSGVTVQTLGGIVGLADAGEHSKEIAGIPAYEDVLAARCGFDESGALVFKDDVSLRVNRCESHQLSPAGFSQTENRSFRAFVARTQDKALQGTILVAASQPYSIDWMEWGKFKPACRKSKLVKQKKFLAAIRNENGFASYLKLCPSDLFETRKEWLCARLIGPELSADDIATSRFWDSRSVVRKVIENGKATKKSIPVIETINIGLVEDFNKARIHLLTESKVVRNLLRRTEDRSLFMNFGDSYSKSLGGVQSISIPDLAINKMESVIESAITKAFAGRVESFDVWVADREPLVETLVKEIYLELMYNLCRRINPSTSKKTVANAAVVTKNTKQRKSSTHKAGSNDASDIVRHSLEAMGSHDQLIANVCDTLLLGGDLETEDECISVLFELSNNVENHGALNKHVEKLLDCSSSLIRDSAKKVIARCKRQSI